MGYQQNTNEINVMGEKHQLKHMDFTKSHHQIDDHQDMLRASPGIVGGKAAAAAFRANKFEEAESLYTEACQNKCRNLSENYTLWIPLVI